VSDALLVYKLFSRQPLSDSLIDLVFTSRTGSIFRHGEHNISLIPLRLTSYPHPCSEWAAYPVLSPEVSVVSQWPPMKLADGVYYV